MNDLDFSSMTDEQLLKLYHGEEKGPDYSSMSDEELLKSYRGEEEREEQPERIENPLASLAAQFGLGALESALLPYEIGVSPLAIPGGQEAIGDLFTRDILSEVYPTEEEGRAPRAAGITPHMESELKEPIDIGVRNLIQKATGYDLHPEGWLEKAASWTGFLKDPKKIKNLATLGLKPKEVIKNLAPTGTEVMRGIGAGIALEGAEQGDLGPIGTMTSMVLGDIAGAGIAGAAKGVTKLITKPKETLAKAAAKLVPAEKQKLKEQLIHDFNRSGLQADLGTLTDSNLIKMLQARIAQSGLMGKAADEFKSTFTNQITREYENIATHLGEFKNLTRHELGTIAKEAVKDIRDADLAVSRQFYTDAKKQLTEESKVNVDRLKGTIQSLEKELVPGAKKSAEQQTVLNTISDIKKDLADPSGASVKALMNGKIALNDIINYEVQGGAKQLLKSLVKEIDRSIISYGKENPTFAKNYIKANQKFSQHAKTFRNKPISTLLRQHDPEMLLNKMNNIQGIRDIGNILDKTQEGRRIMNQLKRSKLEDVIGKNLVDGTTQQVKLGTFSNLLEKGKNKAVIREILGADKFKRLQNLQKNAGQLADAANKFYNASKSGATAVDAAILARGLSTLGNLLAGNPWPLLKLGTGVVGTKKLAQLLFDVDFLKKVEQVILANKKKERQGLIIAVNNLRPYLLQLFQNDENQ